MENEIYNSIERAKKWNTTTWQGDYRIDNDLKNLESFRRAEKWYGTVGGEYSSEDMIIYSQYYAM